MRLTELPCRYYSQACLKLAARNWDVFALTKLPIHAFSFPALNYMINQKSEDAFTQPIIIVGSKNL